MTEDQQQQHQSLGNYIRECILYQYAQAMDAFGEESECRVCRDTATESEPLISPLNVTVV